MINRILDKILSGRYFATISIVGTYCLVVLSTLYLLMVERITTDVFLGIIVGFSGLAHSITKSYFEREDRNKGDNNEKTVTDNPSNPIS